ncbi:hypothetical protein ASC75_24725 [Aminobacter sp. DSM 101952]|uniref:BMP family ABC transporter substrate-binding protein n=1 Tax=Aminobacter sp. DSM 101952 TaxID=2735891 RepID=UPI0006FA0DFD|nr:BMP family ABC transporter substrate-binding protein [Aminobacter sp. DSM 101952]KQU71093.1 hypothetical protein ASC75_24725 [Aminobacter sp. DSM 101952]
MNTIVRIAGSALLAMTLVSPSLADELKIAAVFPDGVENAWTKAWLDSLERIKARSPHGLEIKLDYTENVFGNKIMEVLEAYSESGKYDMIWTHTTSSDQVEELKDEFPDILYVSTGGGNRPVGGNGFQADILLHEASYLAGVYAGAATKSNVLGAIGLFPADNVNDQVNAFRAGARSVNENASLKVTFIESWYDPLKAAEAASAQIAASADVIYQLGETYQICKERKIQCVGSYLDMSDQAPGFVAISTLAKWEPHLNYFIDLIVDHRENGTPFDAPLRKIQYDMSAGGSDITEPSSYVSEEAKNAVAKAKAQILGGELKVVNDGSLPVSN